MPEEHREGFRQNTRHRALYLGAPEQLQGVESYADLRLVTSIRREALESLDRLGSMTEDVARAALSFLHAPAAPRRLDGLGGGGVILDSLLLADDAAAMSGKLYVHGGGITRITPPVLPWVQPIVTVVLRLLADDVADLMAEHTVTIAMVDPAGEPVVLTPELTLRHDEPPALLEGEALYANAALTLAPLPFMIEGLHRIQVDLDGTGSQISLCRWKFVPKRGFPPVFPRPAYAALLSQVPRRYYI